MATRHTETDAQDGTDAGFVPFLGRFFPESLALAVLLALVALFVTTPYLPAFQQVETFTTGFYQLFAVQMALILYWVLSATVVESRPVGELFDRIAGLIPTSQTTIVYSTGVLALALGWVNWALGLLGGVFVGRRLCRRAHEEGIAIHYPAVLTAGLLSLVLANQGPTSPGALLMADTRLAEMSGFLADSGPLSMAEFLLAPANLVPSVVLVLTLPLLLVVLAPDAKTDRTELEDGAILEGSIGETFDHYSLPSQDGYTVADRLEQSRLISGLAVVIGLGSIGLYAATGGGLTLLWLLFSLMILGLLVHTRPMAFRSKTTHATRWANHVAIPFMLYAVVFALLSAAGLYGAIGDALGGGTVGPFLAALGLGLLIPDPASVWVVVGPALIATGSDLVGSVVAVMYGAGLSNLWLGFLFCGILSIRGFDWREFVRYAAVITVYVSVVVLVSTIAL
ncbi:short chain fatty acid transporter [Halalkalicoccus paucihalophilus]|uniref:Short chain fatty acid transporter n=1 Tax=Halalkalicoccus paucihalophilus TaxID=1008153 RepID=A0A151ACC1_9EURY|nr:TIGR00366 family protein [Halalkalicoccus paucihalophilus]KYH25152.1 short chain fatty acid transporter [Halalkalicoccus paucihalophilus]